MATKDAVLDPDAVLHVYEPHRAGLPKFGPYFAELRQRMPFAAEFSKAGIRAAHSQTVFGQLWLVLNPLLMALVYYILVVILRGKGGIDYLAHIVCGLFAFQLISAALGQGASSVTGGGRLILNMAFPRLLMPMAAVRTAFFRFVPTVPVFLVIKAFSNERWGWEMLLSIVFLGLLTLFSIGLAALMATLQVYFRDTSSFLPFFTRIWLYMSPVLWLIDDAPARFEKLMLIGNPLFSLIGGWTDLALRSEIPPPSVWLAAVVWSVIAAVGGSLFFMSREREFAVRI
ncbi:ABC transporter permease [Cellulomonas composti]|uniref:Transport permease protein n=1 Tax=Cellulomonas composti TaxID=266130 RepID=A0A511JBT9_9CELL|nr:ABC transporter permease [Cellulomonas composti]GEL95173.1 transport permease protein [Cellulomonas composti]